MGWNVSVISGLTGVLHSLETTASLAGRSSAPRSPQQRSRGSKFVPCLKNALWGAHSLIPSLALRPNQEDSEVPFRHIPHTYPAQKPPDVPG